jgi:hypothetical protein
VNFTMWVLQDKRGRVWRYTSGKPVVYGFIGEARHDAKVLDPKRQWRVVPAQVTVGGERGS